MPTVWEITPEHPDGFARPMTDSEYSQYQADLVAAAALAASQSAGTANYQTLTQHADAAVATLEDAYTNWATLTNTQKDSAVRLTVRCVAQLIRLYLRKFESAGV